MTIVCGGVFSCTASSNPASTPVTAEVDSETQVVYVDDTMGFTGPIACPGAGWWRAEY
jgi:hypothetical protein